MMVGSNDVARSKAFYDRLFAAVGARPAVGDGKDRLVYLHKGGIFMVSPPLNGAPATAANGGTIGFALDDPAEVDAWHAAGVGSGGASCEDPPGYRDLEWGRFYLAYLRDPDGNKLCGLHKPDA